MSIIILTNHTPIKYENQYILGKSLFIEVTNPLQIKSPQKRAFILLRHSYYIINKYRRNAEYRYKSVNCTSCNRFIFLSEALPKYCTASPVKNAPSIISGTAYLMFSVHTNGNWKQKI